MECVPRWFAKVFSSQKRRRSDNTSITSTTFLDFAARRTGKDEFKTKIFIDGRGYKVRKNPNRNTLKIWFRKDKTNILIMLITLTFIIAEVPMGCVYAAQTFFLKDDRDRPLGVEFVVSSRRQFQLTYSEPYLSTQKPIGIWFTWWVQLCIVWSASDYQDSTAKSPVSYSGIHSEKFVCWEKSDTEGF